MFISIIIINNPPVDQSQGTRDDAGPIPIGRVRPELEANALDQSRPSADGIFPLSTNRRAPATTLGLFRLD
jgi:hypothetical protein